MTQEYKAPEFSKGRQERVAQVNNQFWFNSDVRTWYMKPKQILADTGRKIKAWRNEVKGM